MYHRADLSNFKARLGSWRIYPPAGDEVIMLHTESAFCVECPVGIINAGNCVLYDSANVFFNQDFDSTPGG